MIEIASNMNKHKPTLAVCLWPKLWKGTTGQKLVESNLFPHHFNNTIQHDVELAWKTDRMFF